MATPSALTSTTLAGAATRLCSELGRLVGIIIGATAASSRTTSLSTAPGATIATPTACRRLIVTKYSIRPWILMLRRRALGAEFRRDDARGVGKVGVAARIGGIIAGLGVETRASTNHSAIDLRN